MRAPSRHDDTDEERQPYAGRIVALCLLVAALDGMDVPILGLALPAISNDWGLQPSDFVLPSALGLIGMALGTSILGALGDRYGPRRVMAGSTLLFGLATVALSFADGMPMLSILRLIAGIGLGGALPNALNLIAEHASLRRRAFWLASVGTAMQAGGVVAGILAHYVIGPLGWRVLMLIGGALPIVLCVPLILLIPERQRPESGAPQPETRVEVSATKPPSTFASLFATGERRRTFLFWGSFAALYLGIYLIPTWLPSVLTSSGLPIGVGSLTLAAFSLAGIVGGLAMSVLIGRAGARGPLIVVGFIGAVWALLPVVLLTRPEVPHPLLVTALGMQGLFAIAILVALVALVSESYPTQLRGTGVGAALAAARIGAITASFLGALIVAIGNAATFFAVIGGSLALCALLCTLLPQHRDNRT